MALLDETAHHRGGKNLQVQEEIARGGSRE